MNEMLQICLHKAPDYYFVLCLCVLSWQSKYSTSLVTLYDLREFWLSSVPHSEVLVLFHLLKSVLVSYDFEESKYFEE